MGKVKVSAKAKRMAGREAHMSSLGESIEPTTKPVKPGKEKGNHQKEMVWKNVKTTGRILSAAKEQLEELEETQGVGVVTSSAFPTLGESMEQELVEEYYDGQDMMKGGLEQVDEESFKMFMNSQPAEKKTIADLLKEKLEEKRTNVEAITADLEQEAQPKLTPASIEAYEVLAKFMECYTSGKVPKLLKFLPRMAMCEEILHILEPDSWTAAAVHAASKYFASHSKIRAFDFNFYILLPRVRDDISHFKKLNTHLYRALKQALYRPEEFCTGIVLPLCENGTCTLREAVIICSIIARNSFPMMKASAAMIMICGMEYNGAISIFLRTFIMKKYALPCETLDAIVYHFLSFQHDKREMPVLWHLCLKSFVEIYGKDCASEQRESLRELLKVQKHHLITPDVISILQRTEARDIEMYEGVERR